MKKSIGAKTIVYPTPVFVVGTYDKDGKPNAMDAAWGGICCSSPPCLAISLRKVTYTYENIMAQKAFTVSIPTQDFVSEADYLGLVSGRNEDKFFRSGLTPEKSKLVNAPYVKEFPLALECRLLQSTELGLHTQFIGEILDVKVDMDVLGDGNFPEMGKVKPLMYAPGEHKYYAVGQCLGKAFSLGKNIMSHT